jgi:hypothetical protein
MDAGEPVTGDWVRFYANKKVPILARVARTWGRYGGVELEFLHPETGRPIRQEMEKRFLHPHTPTDEEMIPWLAHIISS